MRAVEELHTGTCAATSAIDPLLPLMWDFYTSSTPRLLTLTKGSFQVVPFNAGCVPLMRSESQRCQFRQSETKPNRTARPVTKKGTASSTLHRHTPKDCVIRGDLARRI
jgi:hypothetical protein